MKNKIILITGATSGIGFQTALVLAKMGDMSSSRGAVKPAEKKQSLKLKRQAETQKLTFSPAIYQRRKMAIL
jgi:NAD(P)-dependent dehydrogenase (short-subunit alcohol dehydrogenase family)